MKDRKDKSHIPILAAGGIVLRHDPVPQFAVVQLRKMNAWGLPKGKLGAGEDAMTAARREVLEETGHRVIIHEFLGTLAYETNSRPKVVQFWRMEAVGNPVGALMRDVKAVRWLPLADALNQLTHLREQVFLEQAGPVALRSVEKAALRAARSGGSRRASGNVVQGGPLAATADVATHMLPTVDILTPAGRSEGAAHVRQTDNAEKTLMKKTWGWFRSAALHWQLPD